MTLCSTVSLAKAIIDCDDCKILRNRQVATNAKWERKLDEFCSNIYELSRRLERGEQIDSQLFQSVMQRIDKVAKNCLHPQQLIRAKDRLLNPETLSFFSRANVSSEAYCPAFTDRGGLCGWLVRSLAVQSALGWVPPLPRIAFAASQTCSALAVPGSISGVDRCLAPIAPPEIEKPRSKHGNRSALARKATKSTVHRSEPESGPRIIDQDHLGGVSVGSWVFFSHMSRLTHFIIDKGQQFFHQGLFLRGLNLARNVTHIGVVTQIDGRVIHVSEIPQYGRSVSTNQYDLDRMEDSGALLFVSPEQLVSDAEDSLNTAIVNVAQSQAPLLAVSDLNQYDVLGAAIAPLQTSGFSEDDKWELINQYIDYLYDFKYTGTNRQYFCSQVVMLFTQLGRLKQRYPIVQKRIDEAVAAIDFQDPGQRARVPEWVIKVLESDGFWTQLFQDPFFAMPPHSWTPARILSLAAHRSSSIVRVPVRAAGGSPFHQIALMKESDYRDFADYLITQFLVKYSEGRSISLQDPEIQIILAFLEKEAGYSRQTLNCFLERCRDSQDPASCIEGCLNETLTWRDKLRIFYTSLQVNQAIDRILENPAFISFVRNPDPQSIERVSRLLKETTLDEILYAVFPLTLRHPVTSFQNYLLRSSVRSADLHMIAKYLPLALAYDSPMDKMRKFAEQQLLITDSRPTVEAILSSESSEWCDDPSLFEAVGTPHFDPVSLMKKYDPAVEYILAQMLVKLCEGRPVSLSDREIQIIFAYLKNERILTVDEISAAALPLSRRYLSSRIDSEFVKRIAGAIDQFKILKYISPAITYALPNASIRSLVLKHGILPLSESESRFPSVSAMKRSDYPDYIKHLTIRLLVKLADRGSVLLHDPEVQNFFALLEKEAGYSPATLNCFLERCYGSKDLAGCIEGCLGGTLTVADKLMIFMSSKELNRAIARILENPDFIAFVCNPHPDPQQIATIASTIKKATLSEMMATIFPMSPRHPIASFENFLVRSGAKSADSTMILKYLPLAIAYAPPTAAIHEFMEKYSISRLDLATRVMQVLFQLAQTGN
jgi:hypothetical protein